MKCVICHNPSGANKTCGSKICLSKLRSRNATRVNKDNPDNNPRIAEKLAQFYSKEYDELQYEKEREDVQRELDALFSP